MDQDSRTLYPDKIPVGAFAVAKDSDFIAR
jgi:hypothetical protein